MLHLQLEETSIYQPDSQDSKATSSSDQSDGKQSGCDSKVYRRLKLNEFLLSCNEPKVGPYRKKSWAETSARTKSRHIAKAKALVVAGLEVIAQHLEIPELLRRRLGLLRSRLKSKNAPTDALAETYRNASC